MNLNDALKVFKSVIDANVPDVYELASGRMRDPENRIFTNDLRQTGGTFPKIFLHIQNNDNSKLNYCGKVVHTNKEKISMNIIYFNKARTKYYENKGLPTEIVYENGGSNISSDLNWRLRELIRDALVLNADDLTGVNNLRFGSFSETSQDGDLFMGIMPVTFDWINIIE